MKLSSAIVAGVAVGLRAVEAGSAFRTSLTLPDIRAQVRSLYKDEAGVQPLTLFADGSR